MYISRKDFKDSSEIYINIYICTLCSVYVYIVYICFCRSTGLLEIISMICLWYISTKYIYRYRYT